jgi:flagellar biosynthesis protein FlhG
MPDQATRLRDLVRQASRREDQKPVPLIAVTGGREGVGATSVAIHLATILSRRGLNVIVLDADLQQAELTTRLNIETRYAATLADVLAHQRSVREALCQAPAGFRILPASAAAGSSAPKGGSADELLGDLAQLQVRPTLIVVDTGCTLSPWAHAWWRAANQVLVVTDSSDEAILDTYSMLKIASAGEDFPAVKLLVTRCPDERTAAAVHRRIAHATYRYLGHLIPATPYAPLPSAACGVEAKSFAALAGELVEDCELESSITSAKPSPSA